MLGPTLFTLFTNDMPAAVTSGTVYMYADDTTVYCVGNTIDQVITHLNNALEELSEWCLLNTLSPPHEVRSHGIT